MNGKKILFGAACDNIVKTSEAVMSIEILFRCFILISLTFLQKFHHYIRLSEPHTQNSGRKNLRYNI